MDKKSHNLSGKIITFLFILSFVLLSIISFSSLGRLRGNAQVINYTGIVRGATQRAVKQALSHKENDDLIQRLDSIIQELLYGQGENNLIPIPDPEFRSLLLQVQDNWEEIKKEIPNVRQGADAQRLYDLSETHFSLSDRAVTAAEIYSENSLQTAVNWLIGLNILLVLLGLLFWYSSAKHRSVISALEAAKLASKEKSSFLSKISHEMRTPMNGIIGMTALAKMNIDDRPKLTDCLGKIELSSRFLLSLINDTLDMSKIESGKVELISEDFDLLQLIDTVRAMFLQKAGEKGIRFNINIYDVTVKKITGDSLRVSQIIINLLSNAMKFTPAGGDVTLDIRQTSQTEKQVDLCFTVTDTGIGMSEEFMSRMFKPFEQADASISHTYGGTGLGLTISHNLIELMNGTVSVNSKEQQGSQFIVNLTFPIADQDVQAESGADEAVSTQAAGSDDGELSGIAILLAEDNEINSEVATAMLENFGAVVTHAWNGRETVDSFVASAPGAFDIILMDVQMPEMDGLEATKAIRKSGHPDAESIPIIALSANSFSNDVEKALACGMNGYLSKPIDIASLYKTIHEFCRCGA